MKTLLDESLPRPLKRELTDHDVSTVAEMGWSGKKNGELLKLIDEQGFEVLLTADRNLRYQQNSSGIAFSLVVLKGVNTRKETLAPLFAEVRAQLHSLSAGQVVEIGN